MTDTASYLSHSMILFVALSTLGCHSANGELIDVSSVGRIPIKERALTAEELTRHLRPESGGVTYAPATRADAQVFGLVLPNLWRLTDPYHPTLEHWNALADRIGYTLERWRVSSDVYMALRELPDRRRGGGLYVIRITEAPATSRLPAILLQTPHIYHDVGTGDLAQYAFFKAKNRTRIHALYSNSVHRYQTAPGKRRESHKSPADVSHNFSHLFNIATRVTAEHIEPLYVTQLHGFDDQDGRKSPVDMVVSASAPELATKTTSALKRRFIRRTIRQYPGEFATLGGEFNVQRKLLARYARAEFVHIEISRPFRNYLYKRSKRRGRLVAALVESAAAHAQITGRSQMPTRSER
jgi:hypothetical protein